MAFISKSQLAALLTLTPQRIGQLTQRGVLRETTEGYDLGYSLKNYIDFLRRDDDGGAARSRHLLSRAINIETKNAMMLRSLLSLDEVRELFRVFTEMALKLAAAESQRFYDSLTEDQDAMYRRQQTDRIWKALRGVALGWAEGVASVLDQVEREHMPAKARLAAQLTRIMAKALARIEEPETTAETSEV